MPKYAVTKNNGKVITITNATHKLEPDWVLITDPNIAVDDVIDNATGALVSKAALTANEQRQITRDEVRRILRLTDWTQSSDNLNNAKQLLWKTYRQAVRDNWAIAKADPNPLRAMVWPDPPGNPDNDGL